MFELKTYQKTTLKVLKEYLSLARVDGASVAFNKISQENQASVRKPYEPINKLEDTPYICLRLPTGGGKTHLAAHSAVIASETFLEREYPLVLWLVPTNIIRKQTLETLVKPGHPNREALLDAFNGHILVTDIADFTQIRPQDLRDKACVVVGTFATLRVTDTIGRKVYAHNEYLEPHFSSVPENTPDLERNEDGPDKGKIKYSFRNLLALNSPMIVVDEAHNASSPLSFEVLQRIKPGCIIEFTATPAKNSNILHNVSASELKAEDMIKLPIMLTEHPSWQEALQDSILTRNKLAEFATHEPDFIRPIVLIQAEEKGREVTIDVVESYLTDQCQISRDRIAIATGNQKELDGINLLDPTNKIEYVITIEALKEGWDCPFAYVLCSVATVHSKKDVEQLLGRVLRMPYAQKRIHEDLNKAYAHVSSASWPHAVNLLHDRLVDMGFDKLEAEQFVEAQPPLFSPPSENLTPYKEPLLVALSQEPDLRDFDLFERANISISTSEDNQIQLKVRGEINEALEKKLVKSVADSDRKKISDAISQYKAQPVRQSAPSERGEEFTIPQLCLLFDGKSEPVDPEWFVGEHGWNLLDYSAELTEDEFRIEEKADSYEIDLSGQKLITRFLGHQMPLDIYDSEGGLTQLQLSRWLDGRLRQPNVRQEVLIEFLRHTLNHLIDRRKISLAALFRTRFVLAKALSEKIKKYETQAYDKGYQFTLFGPQAAVQTTYDYAFRFDPGTYPAHTYYHGHFQFNKHYYPVIGELDSDGEEFECAQAIDRSYLVKHWVRNLSAQPEWSFRLPLADGYFYPDFVAELLDGRILVIEYKGEHLLESEKAKTKQKQNIGELWEEKSGGKGLFVMAAKRDSKGRDVYRQIEDKVEGR